MSHRTFAETRQALSRDETSCEAEVSGFLRAIEQDNERLNVFLSVDAEGALASALQIDERRSRGEDLPLAGLVMGIKDVICIKGQQVTCGSHILENFTSLYDATAIERLR